MRLFKRQKHLTENPNIECSLNTNKVKSDKKDLWIKRAKKGAKYLYAGFLAYCLFVVGTGSIGGYYLSNPNADASVNMQGSGGYSNYYNYDQSGSISVTASRSGDNVNVTVSGTLAYTPHFWGGFGAVITDPNGKVLKRIQDASAPAPNNTYYKDMSGLSCSFSYNGANPTVWIYAGPGMPGGEGDTLPASWRTGNSTNYTIGSGGIYVVITHHSVTLDVPAAVSDTLIYNDNGGSGGPGSQSVNGNATISSTKPTRDGYDFLYWASTNTWANEAKTVKINNSTIDRAFVHSIGNNKYEIMVHTNGSIGNVKVPIWTADGDQSDLAWHPLGSGSWTRDGQYYNWGAQVTHNGDLAGIQLWMHIYAYPSSGGQVGVEYGALPQVFYPGGSYNYVSGSKQSTTIYAVWSAPHTYSVAYNGNGATGGSMSKSNHTYDTAKNLTTNGYTRNGYTFLGWSTSPDGGVQYSDGDSVLNLTATDGETVNLYAQWKQLGYEINYDGNGADGGSTSGQFVPYNQTTSLNKSGYYKKGYKFKEWNSKSNGSGESYKDQQNISVDENKTVTKQ